MLPGYRRPKRNVGIPWEGLGEGCAMLPGTGTRPYARPAPVTPNSSEGLNGGRDDQPDSRPDPPRGAGRDWRDRHSDRRVPRPARAADGEAAYRPALCAARCGRGHPRVRLPADGRHGDGAVAGVPVCELGSWLRRLHGGSGLEHGATPPVARRDRDGHRRPARWVRGTRPDRPTTGPEDAGRPGRRRRAALPDGV